MDFKSQLQEFVQRDGKGSLEYKILNEKGPAHNREFEALVSLKVRRSVSGTDVPKEAEQHAAQEALAKCKNIIRNNKIPCFPRGFQYVCA